MFAIQFIKFLFYFTKLKFLILTALLFCVSVEQIFSSNFTPPPCTIDSIKVIDPLCYGTCDGSVDVYTSWSNPVYFSWSALPGVDTSYIDGLCAGIYHYVITDSAGCIISDSIVLNEPDSIGFSIISQATTCPGGCTGSLTVVPDDTLQYTYHWPGYVSTAPSLLNLCQGTYNVIITNPQGCSVIVTADVEYDDPFELYFFTTPASCANSCDGTATVSGNGTGPLNYHWGTGPIQNTQTAFNLCTGSYLVNVTDSLGCVVTDSVYIDQLAPPTYVVNSLSPTCFGGCDGTAVVSMNSPGNFSFEWITSPPQFDSIATGLCSGTYQVVITDINSGCNYEDSVVVVNPIPPVFSFSVIPSLCNNTCSGAVTVTVSNMIPFSYLWSTGSVGYTDSLLCPGVYSVIVTDTSGCSFSGSVAVGAEELTLLSTTATCNTVCDGSAEVIIPYPGDWTISWLTVPVQNSNAITNLCEGLYSVAIVDSSGCELNGTVAVLSLQPVVVNEIVTDVSCEGLCDGEVNLIVSGNSPFQFVWNTIPVIYTDSLDLLCAGEYSVLITDNIGCTFQDTIIIGEPVQLNIAFDVTSTSCPGVCDAVVEAVPSLPGNFNYLWLTSPLQTGPIVTGLCPGVTYLEITDSAGCVHTDSVFIIGAFPMSLSFVATDISCSGNCDGFLSCQPFGGTPGYDFEWSGGQITQQVLYLCSGTYTVTVTDASGCTAASSYSIIEPDPLGISFNVTPASCSMCNDGVLEVIGSGGTSPYYFQWGQGGAASAVNDSLLPGWYNMCILDNHLCLHCADIYVSAYNSLAETDNGPQLISVYPNPFSRKSAMIIPVEAGTGVDACTINVTDVNGKIVDGFSIRFRGSAPGYLHYELENEGVADGLYFCRVIVNGNTSLYHKFIVISDDN